MPEYTNYDGSGGQLVANLRIELVVLVYALKPDRKAEFEEYYNTTIKKWLTNNYVLHANSWIVDNYLFVVSSSPMKPWSNIDNLGDYVEKLDPVEVRALPRYHFPQPKPAEPKSAETVPAGNAAA